MQKIIKITISTMVLICMCLISLPAQTKAETLVKSIQLKKYSDTLTIKKGEKVKLKVTIKPKKADNKKLEWKSSKKKVVSVSSNGEITGKKKGKATITATTTDGSDKKIKLKVTVGTKVSGMEITNPVQELKKGSVYALKVAVTPSNASNKKIIWTSDDKDVATVDANGRITAVNQGTAEIKGVAADGSGVKVYMNVSVVVYVKSIQPSVKKQSAYVTSVGGIGAYVKCGDAFQIATEILPEDATDKRVTWSSANNEVAIVSDSGYVTAVGCGVAVITVQAVDNGQKKNSFTVYVGRLVKDDCEYIAHRGRSELAPENSLAAIRLALQSDFDSVEFDIWKTIDDEFVVTHDKSLYNMCDVDVDVTQITVAEATSYKITEGNEFEKYPLEYITTLDQVLQEWKDYPDKKLCIELKQSLSVELLEKILQKIEDCGATEHVKLITKYKINLTRVRSLKELGGEDIMLEYLSDEPDMDTVAFCIETNAGLGAKYSQITESQIKMLHENGIKVNIWTLPNFWTASHMIHNMKVDAITSDYQFFE